MRETLRDILEREDVKYEMNRQQMKWRNHYAAKYAQRFSSFYYAFSFNWVFHTYVFNRIAKEYGITQRSFVTLMGCYAVRTTWNVNDMFGMWTVYDTFFTEELGRASYPISLKPLRDAKLITAAPRRGLTAKNRLLIKQVCPPNDTLYQFTDKGLMLPYSYNQRISRKLSEFAKDNGDIKFDVAKILAYLIRTRNNLVGQDKFMIEQMDQVMKRTNDL